jgi:23S rRNA pseudouridine1911/1915/1917 synthase
VLQRGQQLEARIDTGRLDRPTTGEAELAVLYRDGWLLAVAKPAGLQVHASADPMRADLFSVVRRQFDLPYLALHHRLDIETSGVVLLAIDRAANAALSRAFLEHRVEKVYEALTVRPDPMPVQRWTARGPLAAAGSGRGARMRVVPGGQAAVTAITVVRPFRAGLLVEARPATGRRHQVRAHLADAGLPILGDLRYGGPAALEGAPVRRVMLHAAVIRLDHPVTGKPLELRCPRPADFQHWLDRLGGRRRALDSPPASR